MSKFQTSQRIGDIVATLPKASEVFKIYQIDFCCGGNRPLSEAIEELQLEADEVLNKLEEAYEDTIQSKSQTDFIKLSSAELIDYIINTHHAYLKSSLPQISEYTTQILRVHGSNHSELFTIHKLFHNLKTELEQHLIKEEEILFPLIKEYEKNATSELLTKVHSVMKETEEEHEGAGDILKELRKITNDYSKPEDGCGTYCLTYDKLQEMEGDLFQHIHLENNILFQRLEAKL